MERPQLGRIEDSWDLSYRHSAGANGTRFLATLRDDRALLARGCAVCGKVSLPPCSCPDRPENRWRRLSGEGVLLCVARDGADPRSLLASVALDGCDTPVLQRLALHRSNGTEDVPEVAVGARVRAIFAPQPTARMTAFWFEPIR